MRACRKSSTAWWWADVSDLTQTQQQEQHESWMKDSKVHRNTARARAVMYLAFAWAALVLSARMLP